MENYLPLVLIIVVGVLSLFAKKILNTFYGNVFYLVVSTFVIVNIIIDFHDHQRFYSIALLGFALYVMVKSIIGMRKLISQKKQLP
jgi:hypothetical protein